MAVYTLTESKLRNMIREAVKTALNETDDARYYYQKWQEAQQTLDNYMQSYQQSSQRIENDPESDPYGLNGKIANNLPPRIKKLQAEVQELKNLWWEASQKEMQARQANARRYY